MLFLTWQRNAIDPFAYTHQCDNRGTYVPKHRPTIKKTWTKVSDSTGRGFGSQRGAKGIPLAGTIANFQSRDDLPKVTMATILT